MCASEAGSLYFYTVRPALSDALPERQKALRQISVSECEFSKPVDQVFLIQATSMSPTACRKHRVCSTLTFYHRLRKYQHSPTDICLRAFCLYSKRQFLRKKYKNIRFCYVKSLYFRYTSKIKKFRTKNPDFGTFLYGIRCFGAFYTKLSIYRNFPAQYSSYYNVITITLHDFGRVSL